MNNMQFINKTIKSVYPTTYSDNRYRILKHTSPDGHVEYEVQKRFLGFLWWYNFNNIGPYEDGFYDTLEEAVREIRLRRGDPKSTTEIM